MNLNFLFALLCCSLLPAIFARSDPTCVNPRNVLESITGDGAAVHSHLRAEAGTMCQLRRTCCSSSVEGVFIQDSVQRYEGIISGLLRNRLSSCANVQLFESLARFVNHSKDILVQDAARSFGFYFRREHSSLFDRFYNYLSNTMLTGNTDDLTDEFHHMFFDVYLAAYLANPRTPSDIAQNRNPSFRRCFYNYFLESNGGTVAEHIRIFQLAFNNTYRYLRGLKAMERVVGGILQYALSEQCKMSLMRMTHCAQCAGYPNTTKTCSGFCLNTMRGCLLDLAGLVEPLESFSQALIAMKNRVSRNNPAQAITTIEADVFMMISTAGASSSITRALRQRCTTLGKRSVQEEEEVEEAAIPRPRSRRNTIPILNQLVNSTAYCLKETLPALKRLPDVMCNGSQSSNNQCWNGRLFGNYARDVVGFNRSAQRNNPEVLICPHDKSQFRRDIHFLRQITKELASLSGLCDVDDEDCPIVPPRNDYYNFTSFNDSQGTTTTAAPYRDTEDEMSSSGSGSEDEDPCSIGGRSTVSPPPATPSASTPPPTTSSDTPPPLTTSPPLSTTSFNTPPPTTSRRTPPPPTNTPPSPTTSHRTLPPPTTSSNTPPPTTSSDMSPPPTTQTPSPPTTSSDMPPPPTTSHQTQSPLTTLSIPTNIIPSGSVGPVATVGVVTSRSTPAFPGSTNNNGVSSGSGDPALIQGNMARKLSSSSIVLTLSLAVALLLAAVLRS